jgi:electron transfer flavoprotein alpha/beta subunit
MKIIVCLKSCRRMDIPLRLSAEGHPLDDGPGGHSPSSHELAPLLAAMALKAQIPALEVKIHALCVGPPAWEHLLRHALAIGADHVLRIWGGGWHSAHGGGSAGLTRDSAFAAAESISRLRPQLVLTGAKSSDTGQECFGAFMAHRLGAPLAHRAVELVPRDDGWQVRVKLERGYTQEMVLSRPAVVTLAGQPTELPYPSLTAWMAALSAPIPLAAADGSAVRTHHAGLRSPIPRVKRFEPQEAGMNAEGRIRAMVSITASEAGTILPAEMGAEEQARKAAEFLKDRGYIRGA